MVPPGKDKHSMRVKHASQLLRKGLKVLWALPSWSVLLCVDQKDSVVILILEASSTRTVRLSLIDLRLTT